MNNYLYKQIPLKKTSLKSHPIIFSNQMSQLQVKTLKYSKFNRLKD